jgi:hypothetical protein
MVLLNLYIYIYTYLYKYKYLIFLIYYLLNKTDMTPDQLYANFDSNISECNSETLLIEDQVEGSRAILFTNIPNSFC